MRKVLSKDPGISEFLKNRAGPFTKSSNEMLGLLMTTHFPPYKDEVNDDFSATSMKRKWHG